MTWDPQAQRPREMAGNQRFDGVQDDTINLDPDFSPLPVVEMDMEVDFNAELRALVVRNGDSDNHTAGHVSFAGMSLSREQATQLEELTDASRRAADRSILPCLVKSGIRMAAKLADDMNVDGDGTTTLETATGNDLFKETDLKAQTRTNAASKNGNMRPFLWLPTTAIDTTGLGSIQIGCWPKSMTRNKIFDLLRRGRTGTDNAITRGFTNLMIHTNTGAGQNTRLPTSDAEWDHIALRLVYSSALDFLMQWRNEIDTLRTSLVHFQKNEAVGQFEKGNRGTLDNNFSDKDVLLMTWFTQLGYYSRTGALPDNLRNDNLTTFDEGHYGGFWCPFFMKVRNYNGSDTREWISPWLAAKVDSANFTYTADAPQYGITMEDMFVGYNMLMDAVTEESGMAARALFPEHLDFFSEAVEGVVPDTSSEDSRTSVTALRHLQKLGFKDVVEFQSPNGVPDLDKRFKMEYFKDFFDGNVINKTALADHKMDIADLEKIQLSTLMENFKRGMQKFGDSSTTFYDRTFADGSTANVKLNFRPVTHCRMTTIPMLMGTGSTSGINAATGAPTDNCWLVTQTVGLTQAKTCALPTSMGPWTGSWSDVHVVWPSMAAGYAQYDEKVKHARTSAFFDTPSSSNAQVRAIEGAGLGYGVCTNPDGKLLFGGDAVPFICSDYLRLSRNSWLVTMLDAVTRILNHYSVTTAALPFKSTLDIVQPQSLNIIREITMRQGESLVQKDLAALLTYLHCGTNAADIGLRFRGDLDRKLDNFDIHKRPARYAGEGGADYITFILPDSLVPEDPTTVHALACYMSWNMGLMRHSDANITPSVADVALDYNLQATDRGGRSYHLINLVDDGSGSITHIQQSIRYFKVSKRFRDGTPDFYESIIPSYSSAKSLDIVAGEFGKHQLAVDFSQSGTDNNNHLYGTISVAGGVRHVNSAMILPGHYELYQAWPHLAVSDAGGVDNSICGLGGLLNGPLGAGSNVTGLLGYSRVSPAFRSLLEDTGLVTNPNLIGRVSTNKFTTAQMDAATTFDPNMWRAIVEERGTYDDVWWNNQNWKVIALDQDLLDFDRSIFTAIGTKVRILYLGPLHRGVIMDSNGEIVREMEGISAFSSMGGVAVGKNNYSDGSMSEPTGDRDGDATTSIPDDGED